MFNLLGTPADRKRRVVYESSHGIPGNEMIKEVGELDGEILGCADVP